MIIDQTENFLKNIHDTKPEFYRNLSPANDKPLKYKHA